MEPGIEVMIRGDELCQCLALSPEELREIVAHGIVAPANIHASDWRFAPEVVTLAARAVRLHRDLLVDWPGVALAIDLLEEMRTLRRENRLLRRRLQGFDAAM